ncbi:MAG: DUF4192 family protein, partial [Microbacterium sp.]
MTTIVKAADAAEFLSLVPRMLGFTPRRSLVVIPFAGARSLGAMRFDLPDDDAAVDRIAATVIGMACRVSSADAVALVVYADESATSGAPRRALTDALEGRAHACGLDVTDAMWVASDGWGRYGGDGLVRELSELGGRTSAGDQASGADLPEAARADRDAVSRALSAFGGAVRVLCGPDAATGRVSAVDACDLPADDGRVDPQALAAVCALDDLPALFEGMLAWDATSLAPFDAATIAWCLARPALRDIALVQWCRGQSGGDEALDAQLRWEDGEEYPAHLAMQMWGEGERPDPERLAAALGLARRVAALAPPSHRAGSLATAAWISWALGRSTHADLY